ncbi:MAG: structural protein P5 [Tannerellaceae bacterium]|jgi:hypothetical protein|nr:structural protein P5 [Tannerellaceae bacterium]
MVARGLRNNNPGNIRKGGRSPFEGEIVPSADSAFRQFRTMDYGYAAMFVLLAVYLTTGRNTIERIIRSWAPPVENNTLAYIGKVERLSGVLRAKVLTVNDGESIIKIVAAMSEVENAVKADMTSIKRGFLLQNKIRR